MRLYLSFILMAFLGTAVSAQNLNIQHDGEKLYLNHKVAAKENWYSIGRIYNASPKEMAPFNNTSLDKGLSIGQQVKVPLTTSNFIQSGTPGVDEVLVPLYHKVKEKEGLYRISQTYNKVSPEQLKSWNKLKSDELANGTELIVGYLKVKQDISPLAASGQRTMTSEPVAKKTTTTTEPVKQTDTPQAKEAAAKTTAVSKSLPESTSTSVPVSKPVADAPGTEGAFAALFAEQTKNNPKSNIGGQAASFKSTSGWKDGKYYVLMNKVTPGTIIKISSSSSNKIVYAKVLGEIPPGKENDGLLIRLSNAATAQLQMPEGRFDVQLQY
jgi:LysM repeat protein